MAEKIFDKMSEPMRNAYTGGSTEWPTVSEWKRMRNKEIVRLFDDEHVTMTAMAGWFGISKKRVQQIYKKEKESVPVLTKSPPSERNSEIVRLIDEQLMTKTAVAKLYKISKQRVWQIYRKDRDSVQNLRPARNWEDDTTS